MMTNKVALDLPWRKSDFMVVDLEGTGAQHREQEGIVEIAAIPINNMHVSDNYFYKLVNPEIDIPPMISRIHGLKNKDLINEPFFEVIRAELSDFLGETILVGHNVIVDYRVLKLKMPNYQPSLILDTKKLSRHFWPSEPKHGLDDLIARFNIKELLSDLPIKRGRHSAFYDAQATAIIFLMMLSDKLGTATIRSVARICGIEPDEPKNNQSSLFS